MQEPRLKLKVAERSLIDPDSALQVRVNRAVKRLTDLGAIKVVDQQKTHGGLVSKTYAITEMGFLDSLYAMTFFELRKNVKSLVKDIKQVLDANYELLPLTLGLLRSVPASLEDFKELIWLVEDFLLEDDYLWTFQYEEGEESVERVSHSDRVELSQVDLAFIEYLLTTNVDRYKNFIRILKEYGNSALVRSVFRMIDDSRKLKQVELESIQKKYEFAKELLANRSN
jgi:hypothetical protein